MTLTLVIGGTRSGKSAHAERLAEASGLPVRYVGTANPSDGSMASRIELHRNRRPAAWDTVTAGDQLAATVTPHAMTVIDGLGGWIAGRPRELVQQQISELITAARVAAVIVVAELAGEGLLPMDRVSREWLDLLGEQVERLSAVAANVHQVVAGRVIELPAPSSEPTPPRLLELTPELAPTPPPATAGGEPTSPSQHSTGLRHHGDREVRPGDRDHAVNVLAGGAPHWLKRDLQAALDGAAGHYPDDSAAIAATAARHGRHPDEIIVTNGAAEALWLLGPALRPRLAAILHPAFTESEAALRAHRVAVTHVPRTPGSGFAIIPEQIPAAADLVIVGNPASPDGTLYPAERILSLRAPGRTLVVDEAFMSMVPGERESLASQSLPDVIVVRSLTKLLSIPGLRAGYALAAPELAAKLREVRPPWSANVLALAALTAAAAHPDETAALAVRAAAEAADLQAGLQALLARGQGPNDLKVHPPAANFCLIETADAPRIVAALRARQVAVRPAGSFPGLDERFIRITAREPAANAALIEELAMVMQETRPQ